MVITLNLPVNVIGAIRYAGADVRRGVAVKGGGGGGGELNEQSMQIA